MEKNLSKLLLIIILVGGMMASSLYVFLSPPKKISNTFSSASPPQEILSPELAVKKAVEFINNNYLAPRGEKAELVNVSEESGLYKFKIKIGEREYTSFVTKDGKILFPGEGVYLDKKLGEVPKRERPDVKLFVMSYCPFGLQMQKALLPAWELLKEKADIGVYFVSYIMHGKEEMEENLRQYCIQKEEKEKYLSYLNCFLKEGKFKDCLSEAKIDENRLIACQKSTDQEFQISAHFNEKAPTSPFNVHKELNEKYGVQGSPTLVINDQVVEVQRSPEKVKEAICNAFSTPPKECETTLSSTSTSPGFGFHEGIGGEGACR